jgi:prepilin-type N-terminal cleavage/methylation domain-containing protein
MRKQKGFTLIELLVVIAIIGLLSTLAVVALNNARQKSRDAKRVSDIKQMQTALELYYTDNNMYASSTDSGKIASTTNTYMGAIPANPTPNGTNYVYLPCTGSGGTYSCFRNTPTMFASSYVIEYTLEGATGQLPSGPASATPSGIR